MSSETKSCFKCGEVQPLVNFYAHPQMGDGHLNKCKACTRKDARDHRNDNLQRVREYDRSRANLPQNVERRRQYHERFVRENPEKYKAHNAVSNALRDGKLTKQPCAFCGTAEPVEAHHHDYSKPLDVTWLCKPCHRRFHALERMATYREDAA